MYLDISKKVVLITGASRGIGRQLVYALAKEGASVIINYKDSEREAISLLADICDYNDSSMIIQCDISKSEDVKRMYTNVIDKYKYIDLLINNAGISMDRLSLEMDEEIWRRVIDTNLTGCFLCSKEFANIMVKNKKGKILNIASLKGQEGGVRQCNYAASKAGMIALTKSLAKELGDSNVLVNVVCPGFIQTDLNRNCIYKKTNAQKRSAIKNDYALNDLIYFTMLYASDCFRGVSGQVFNLDSRILTEI